MYKTIAIKRIHECKFGDECKLKNCRFLHYSRYEKYGEIVEYKEIDKTKLYKTKVCYDFQNCQRISCSYAHNEYELEIKYCKRNRLCKNKELCKFYHMYTSFIGYPIRKYKKYNDYGKKQHHQFELMKEDILFDKNVIPLLLEIFIELGKLKPDIEKLIISYFPVFKY